MKRAIIFDFDGTIADSLPAVIAVFEELTKRPKSFTPKEVAHYQRLSLLELIAELGIPKWKVPVLLVRGRNMLQKHMNDIAVHEGMADIIKELHAAGDRLYILSSNSTENVTGYLVHHKLSSYFSGVYGGASLLGKAPRLNKLIAAEKVDLATSWYIGDETRDVIAARAVGLHVASVSWGYNSRDALKLKEPDFVADTAKELLAGITARGNG